jgi:transcriptional regulator with XRE-family HTH domain
MGSIKPAQLEDRIRALRKAGKSRRQIRQIVGPVGNRTLDKALRAEPPPEWTRRPNSKDDERDRARALRAQGLDYAKIAAQLGVSKSSVSLWVRDLPVPQGLRPEERAKRTSEMMRVRWATERPARAARRAAEISAASDEIGALTDREILIAGAVAYWCEGTKKKPGNPAQGVSFVNSDPEIISFFMRFLDVAGVPRSDRIFALQIHETAAVATAERFWADLTGAPSQQFRKTTLKPDNPLTNRRNTGVDYHGCLRIDVRNSSCLYRKIQGWVLAVTGET